MSQLTFIPQRDTNASPGASSRTGDTKGHFGNRGDRNGQATRWSDVWSECHNDRDSEKKAGNANVASTLTEPTDQNKHSTQIKHSAQNGSPAVSGSPGLGGMPHHQDGSGAVPDSRVLMPGMSYSSFGNSTTGAHADDVKRQRDESNMAFPDFSGNRSGGTLPVAGRLDNSGWVAGHEQQREASRPDGNTPGSNGNASDSMARPEWGAGGLADSLAGRGAGYETRAQDLPGMASASKNHIAGQSVIAQASYPGSATSVKTDTLHSFAGSNIPGAGVGLTADSGSGMYVPATDKGADPIAPGTAYPSRAWFANAGSGEWAQKQKVSGASELQARVPSGASESQLRNVPGIAEPKVSSERGVIPGMDREMELKQNGRGDQPVTQWLSTNWDSAREKPLDNAGSAQPSDDDKVPGGQKGGQLTTGQPYMPARTEGAVSGADPEPASRWQEKVRILFEEKKIGRQNVNTDRHNAHIRSFAERGSEPVTTRTPGSGGIAAASGETVLPRPVQSLTPSPHQTNISSGTFEQSQFDWEKITVDTDTGMDEADERRDATLQLSQIGRLPLTSADLRRELLPGLVRIQQHAKETAASRNNAWQNHRIQIADGSNMRISTREVDGVLQLKLGSSNTELNRLLQQHFHEIREHLEKECEITVELQLDSGQTDGFERFFGQSGKDEKEEHYRELSDNRTEPRSVEKVAPQPVRNFGYNQMEWTI